jgi:hypothetical protein
LGLYHGWEDILVLYAPKFWVGLKFKPVLNGLGAIGILWLMNHSDSIFSYALQNVAFNPGK